MAKESTKFSVDCFTLAKKIYSFKKTLIAYTFNNESLSLIYTAEKLVKSIKTANTTPLTSKLYKEILENSKEFLQVIQKNKSSIQTVKKGEKRKGGIQDKN